MNRNVEIKAKVYDFKTLYSLVESLSDKKCITLRQRDTFFNCRNGRLKLRIFEDGAGELIFYNRVNTDKPKCSYYKIVKIDKPSEMCELLQKSYGIKGEVIKTRYLFFIGQTRIHLDKVKNLGDFMELEVVLKENQTEEEGITIANNIMEKLKIDKKDLIDKAYIDLLENS